MRRLTRRPLLLLLALSLLLASGHAARHLLGHAIDATRLGAFASAARGHALPVDTPGSVDAHRAATRDPAPAAHCDACDGLQTLVDVLTATPPLAWLADASPATRPPVAEADAPRAAPRLAYRSRAPPAA